VIENTLFFALGFLVSATLALFLSPVLWRRAGELMRRRIEATLPMTREELEAEIDAVKAEHVMAMRLLEMKNESLRRKAADDLVELNVLREKVEKLKEYDAAMVALEAERNDLTAQLAERDAELQKRAKKIAQLERQLQKREREIEELSSLYEEASLTASTRQIDLVAREASIEQLNDSVSLLRTQRKEADRLIRDAMAKKAAADEALLIERARADDLERKLDSMIAALSTREEKLERREKELARLKRKLEAMDDNNTETEDVGEERARLEAQVAELSLKLSSLLAPKGRGGKPSALRKPEMERLQSRLAVLMRENKRLRAELAGAAHSDQADDGALRERVSDLAANMVDVVATLEGPDSPIEKALSQQEPNGKDDRPLSLADRVRSLRGRSAAG
jgi:chromosome segregation ATPase